MIRRKDGADRKEYLSLSPFSFTAIMFSLAEGAERKGDWSLSACSFTAIGFYQAVIAALALGDVWFRCNMKEKDHSLRVESGLGRCSSSESHLAFLCKCGEKQDILASG